VSSFFQNFFGGTHFEKVKDRKPSDGLLAIKKGGASGLSRYPRERILRLSECCLWAC